MADKRIEKTKKAIEAAFLALARDQEYENIHVQAIAARAEVGRSTFYKHFNDKDDVLVQAMTGVLTSFSNLDSSDQEQLDCLEFMLEHFRQNRARARKLFTGLPGKKLAIKLAECIEYRYKAVVGGKCMAVSLRFQSELAAHAQFSLRG